jgi:serine/threonine protein phosphatase PrpC
MDRAESFTLRYAARSDVGLRRKANEDSGYASPRLLAVADGIGGHAHGEVASSAVIAAMSALDDKLAQIGEGDLLATMEQAVRDVNRKLREMAGSAPSLKGMGTTLTAMLWHGNRFVLAHVGDSRAYLLRDGTLYQITRDHTLVQSLVDDGRMTPEQAAAHPRRSMLVRALESGADAEPDLCLREAQAGDRYLLCSDGLTAVVEPEALHEVLSTTADLDQVAARLVDLANQGGGPDNITCIVADVLTGVPGDPEAGPRIVVGAPGGG